MIDIDRWKEVWASISNNKLRTALSGLTITMALFVFITLFGLGKGLENGFQENFFRANSLNVMITPGRTTIPYMGYKKGREIQLKNDDTEYIESTFDKQSEYVTSYFKKTLLVKGNVESGSYTVTGVLPNYQYVSGEDLEDGRFLNEDDIADRKKSIVIGTFVAKDLFRNRNPLGQNLNVGGSVYKVVGVFESEEGDDANRVIYAPLSTLQTVYGTDNISNIVIVPKKNMSLAEIEELATTIEGAIKVKHKVHMDDYTGLRINNAAKAMGQADLTLFILIIIVFIIGSGSLVAGVVSVGNIMIFSVKERTKEIGIRKALGATPNNIIALVMLEAVLLTFVFGILGIVLGTLLIENIGDSLEEYFFINPNVSQQAIIMASIVLFVAGFLAGFLPARRAAKINTIEALRDNE